MEMEEVGSFTPIGNETDPGSSSQGRSKDELKVNRKNIAWKSDREHNLGRIWEGSLSLQFSKQLSDREDLIVWMRTVALPTFRKLYGKIEEDLDADDVILVQLLNN